MKPTPLSAMLADDLLLDRVGARLDADDELGSLLLAVAHRADTPIPRAALARRVRPHRGLTVLAAIGVAVSGATVAAAVELAPVPPDQASGVPHARAFLPPSLQALVLPFLSGSPFQGRLVLPFGAVPGVTLDGSVTALGLPATALPSAGQLMEPLSVATQEAQLDKQEHDDQQDAQRQKVQAKDTPATGQEQTPVPADDQADDQADDESTQPVEAAPEPKPKPTPTPTSTPTSGGATTGATLGATNGANGQTIGAANGANGAANGQGHGRGGERHPHRRPDGRHWNRSNDGRRPAHRRPGQGQGQGRDRSPRGRRDGRHDHRHDGQHHEPRADVDRYDRHHLEHVGGRLRRAVSTTRRPTGGDAYRRAVVRRGRVQTCQRPPVG